MVRGHLEKSPKIRAAQAEEKAAEDRQRAAQAEEMAAEERQRLRAAEYRQRAAQAEEKAAEYRQRAAEDRQRAAQAEEMAAEDRLRAAKAEEMAAEDRLRAAKAEEMAAEDRQRAAQAEEKVAQADARTQEVERKLRGKLLVWFCWCCWSDGFSWFPSSDFTFSNLWPGPFASPTIDHEIAIPFVNREKQVDILARILLQSRAVIDTASNRGSSPLPLPFSLTAVESPTLARTFWLLFSAGHYSPVDPDAPPLHTLQFFDELTRAIYIRADISECWTTDATSTLNHTILLGVLRTVREIPAQQLHQQTGYESLSALEEALRKALDGALISIPCYRFVEILQTVFGRNVSSAPG